jgi:hypothetical protein
MPAAVDLRLLRAAVFAAACVALATTGHLVAGGGLVAPWAPVLGWLLVFALAVPLTGRRRHSLPAVAALLAGAQLTLHGLFARDHSGGDAGAAAGGGAPAGGRGGALELAARLLCNDHAVRLTLADAERLVLDAGLPLPSGGSGAAAGAVIDPHAPASAGPALSLAGLVNPAMLAGHLLAALLTGWLLLRGEAALWRLIELSARTLPQALLAALRTALACVRLRAGAWPAMPALSRPRTAGPHPTAATRGTVLPDSVIRRGPPASAGPLALAA